MEVNPKLPVALNGRRKTVNLSGLPALTAPYQLAESSQGSAILLPKWRAALAGVKTSMANARILCIGDSITFGYGSAATNLKPLAWPTALAQSFNALGINAHSNSIACNGNGATAGGVVTNANNDSRVSLGSGWSGQTLWIGVGGGAYGADSATSNFSFTPTEPVDTFIITYGEWGSGGTFSANIDGGSNTNQSTSGISAATLTLTTTLGLHTINLNYVSGNIVLITGIEAYDSSKKWVSVINAGFYGSNTYDWTQNTGTWSPINQGISIIAPALTIIALGINDIDTGTISPNNIPNGVTQANLQLLINAAKASGDVVLQTTIPANPTYPMPISMQQGLYQTLVSLAAKNNLAIIDTYGRFQSYAVSNGNGLMYDSFHPNALGYSDIASAYFNLVGQPFIPSGIIDNADVGFRTATTSPVTMQDSDNIVNINLTTPGAVAITGASNRTIGKPYTIVDAAGNAGIHTITYTPASGNVNGASTATITSNYGRFSIFTDGINEFINSV